MQDRYVGDVGDFGKYGLLRHLCGPAAGDQLRLAVNWYLAPCEDHNFDGKHLTYLSKPNKYRSCDPELFDCLARMYGPAAIDEMACERAVAAIEAAAVLPHGTQFFSERLACVPKEGRALREKNRAAWLANALKRTAEAEMTFLDPDNGIECPSVELHHLKAPKYTYYHELDEFADAKRGQSLVIYHHLNRNKSTDLQVAELKQKLTERYAAFATDAVVFTRGTRRAFFVLAHRDHQDLLRRRLAGLFKTAWRGHFLPSD